MILPQNGDSVDPLPSSNTIHTFIDLDTAPIILSSCRAAAHITLIIATDTSLNCSYRLAVAYVGPHVEGKEQGAGWKSPPGRAAPPRRAGVLSPVDTVGPPKSMRLPVRVRFRASKVSEAGLSGTAASAVWVSGDSLLSTELADRAVDPSFCSTINLPT